MRIYISGQITGDDHFEKYFQMAKEHLQKKMPDADIVNPALLNEVFPDGTHGEYMKICLQMLKMSDTIYMLRGWRNSTGACIEYGYALALEMTIYEE